MIVYEFWLKDVFNEQAFRTLCETFYTTGGEPVNAISWNPRTNWIQILINDDMPQPAITAIEARMNGLKDAEPLRKYEDDLDELAPIETPKYFTLERVLRVRQKQKDGTLRRVEDA